MPFDWQITIALLLVALSVGVVARRVVRLFRKGSGGRNCSGCSGNSGGSNAKAFVGLDQLESPLSRRSPRDSRR